MRRTLAIVIALLLAITLLPACGGGGEEETGDGGGGGGGTPPGGNETPPGGTPSAYTGFMAAAKGQWADYTMVVDGEESHQIWENIGEDTVDGENCVGLEMTTEMAGEETIAQIWTNAATGQMVKYVMKSGGQVICMGQPQYEPPETETPSEYSPDTPDISYGTYTVPGNGQTVNVAIFETGPGSEAWVSSEVPFGKVKVVASGTATMSLVNFGTSGAVSDISPAERDNCFEL